MKYQFIASNRSSSRVKKMCRTLKVSRSGFYGWQNRDLSERQKANRELLPKLVEVFKKSRRTYGSPSIARQLKVEGEYCGKNRVARLMRLNGIKAKTKKKFKVTTNSDHDKKVADNLVNQHFVADYPDRLWCSDITYLWTKEGWLYLAVILDVYSRRIIGWSMSNRITEDLVITALNRVLSYRTPTSNTIFHSDQGRQYASGQLRKLLDSRGIQPSMSSKGNCYDNAITETFFHTLKTELTYFENYQTREEAKSSIFEYIEVFYNRQRRHSALDYKSPVDFENEKT
jgi:putative transposase